MKRPDLNVPLPPSGKSGAFRSMIGAVRMERLSLRFADARVEASFAEEQARKSLRPVRVALVTIIVGSMLIALAFRFLLQLLPAGPRMPWIVLSGAGIGAAFYALSRSGFFVRRQQAMMVALACLLSAGLTLGSTQASLDLVVSRGYLFMVIHTFTVYSVLRLRFPAATIAGLVSLGIWVGGLTAADVLRGVDIFRHAAVLVMTNIWGMVICYQMDLAARREYIAMRELTEERARSERLLLNILPASIAERLKGSEASIADHSAEVTVLFADIVGFTPLSARKTPQALVEMLNRIFSEFDSLAEAHGLEKIKTIGDAYMAVAGLPEHRSDHAQAAAYMAIAMLQATARIAAETGEALALRIGLNSGPVVAGVIGRKKFSYDLWGDTVNTASRMESHGAAGMIQCTSAPPERFRDPF